MAKSATESAAQLLHRDLESKDVAGRHDPLEPAIVDAGEEPDPVAEARLVGHVAAHDLGERLHLQDGQMVTLASAAGEPLQTLVDGESADMPSRATFTVVPCEVDLIVTGAPA